MAMAWQTFRDTVKKHWCNYFEYHRRGLSMDREKPWEDRNIPSLFQEPTATQWDGRYQMSAQDVRAALALQTQSRVGYEAYTGSGGSRRRRKRVDAQAAADAVKDKLSQQGVAVRLSKLLGWGGNGVASLFEVWPRGEDAPSKKVVVKSLLRSGVNMTAETSFNMVRATSRGRVDAARIPSAD